MTEEEVEGLLDSSTPFWAKHCAKIIDKRFQLVPFEFFTWQDEVDAILEDQRARGLPGRVIIGKARQLGFSTYTQGKALHKGTRRPNQKALIVAHESDTGYELFETGETIYNSLPAEVKPRTTHLRKSKGSACYLRLENNSTLEVDTAKNVEGGRGYTPSFLHLSEFAFYENPRKITALVNGVPETPETIVVVESTAKGFNHFQKMWKAAVDGESAYVAYFAAWWRDPQYSRAFDSIEEREEFEAALGQGEYGEDEPGLLEMGVTLEQLHWRRYAIRDKCAGDVDTFHEEYPSTPDEMFLTTGRKVFAAQYVARVQARAAVTDPEADVGVLVETGSETLTTREGTVEVPTGAIYVPKAATSFSPRHPMWKIWEHPVAQDSEDDLPDDERSVYRPGQYVLGVDVAGGEEMTDGTRAFHAIDVTNHVTGEQCALWVSRMDPHELVREVFLAGLYWNKGLIAVEITGGWGWPIVRRLNREYRYPYLYKRKVRGSATEKEKDALGWQTAMDSKADMEGLMIELLSTGSDGTRAARTASEMGTYVSDDRGRTGPEDGSYSDALMARMIARAVAREIRPRPNRRPGENRNVSGLRTPPPGAGGGRSRRYGR